MDKPTPMADCPISLNAASQFAIDGEISAWVPIAVSADLERRLSALQADARWIPVGERLPEEGVRVLLQHKDGSQWTGHIAWEKPMFEDNFRAYQYFIDEAEQAEWEHGDITHWMPLPAAPDAALNAREGKS